MIYLTWRHPARQGMLYQPIRGTHGEALLGAQSSDTAVFAPTNPYTTTALCENCRRHSAVPGTTPRTRGRPDLTPEGVRPVPTLAPSPAWHTLDYPRVLDLIKTEIDRIGALIAEADDAAVRVPSCPEWTLAELVRHTGEVHRWAAAILTRLPQERIELTAQDRDLPHTWGAETT